MISTGRVVSQFKVIKIKEEGERLKVGSKILKRYYPAWQELRNKEKRKIIWRLLIFTGFILFCVMVLSVEAIEVEKVYYEEEKDGKKILKYEGGLKDGKYHAKGALYYPNGNIEYKGEFYNGMRNGKGISYDLEGNEEYRGNWKDDRKTYD